MRWLASHVILWLPFSTHQCCKPSSRNMLRVTVLMAGGHLTLGRNLPICQRPLLLVSSSFRPVYPTFIDGLVLSFIIQSWFLRWMRKILYFGDHIALLIEAILAIPSCLGSAGSNPKIMPLARKT
jgi:hypothetical protein